MSNKKKQTTDTVGPKQVQQLRRVVAIRLRKHGVSPVVVADSLGVSKHQVAAWLAHDTMGTYK